MPPVDLTLGLPLDELEACTSGSSSPLWRSCRCPP